jgi:hypothetical protein
MTKARTIVMLGFPQGQLLDIAGPLQMFAGANDALGCDAYRLEIAALRSVHLPPHQACAWWPIFRLSN